MTWAYVNIKALDITELRHYCKHGNNETDKNKVENEIHTFDEE